MWVTEKTAHFNNELGFNITRMSMFLLPLFFDKVKNTQVLVFGTAVIQLAVNLSNLIPVSPLAVRLMEYLILT